MIFFALAPKSGSARYSVDRLRHLRQPLYEGAPDMDRNGRPLLSKDYFRLRTLRWYLKGGYTVTKLIAEQEEHQQRLIQLGYYSRREFQITNRNVDQQFIHLLTNGVQAESVWYHMDHSRVNWLRVTARTVDMPIIEHTILANDIPHQPAQSLAPAP